MKVKFCGAARQVTGSAHLITLDSGFTILLDCGLFQGSKEVERHNESWLFNPEDIDCLILSHAHIDHTGRLPKLVKDGFRGKIYSTHATRSLCAIMLLDSAFIQERDTSYYNKNQRKKKGKKARKKEPLYTAKHVKPAMDLFVSTGYDQWLHINNEVEVLFRDAGHILGSANVTLRIKDKGRKLTFGFTGDIGRPNRPILRDPQVMPEVDYLICESTYGDKVHAAPPAEHDKLLQIIKSTCLEKGGKLIIPAFSVGRTQEIVYMMDQMETAGKLPNIPVYVDSPLAVNATEIFGTHPECFDNELNQYMLIDDNPFGFNALTYIRKVEISKSLNDTKKPCVIISSSGMMNAGRVKHHLFNNIEHPKNTFLIVGYCAENTPGRKLRDGLEEIRLFGQMKKVRANVEIMDSFSAHADKNEMTNFLERHKGVVKKVFLVHGDWKKQQKFAQHLHNKGHKNVEVPGLGEEFVL